MASRGRPRKATEQLKLEGTFRKDRHSHNADAVIADVVHMPSSVDIPDSLTDPYVKEYYQHHASFLCQLHILAISDLPELETMFLILQQMRQVRKELDKLNVLNDMLKYETVNKIWMKLASQFSQLATKYFISPSARNKITLDALDVERKKKDLEKDETATARLLRIKKS